MSIVAVARRTIEIPAGVTVTVDEESNVNVQGPNGQLARRLFHPQIQITIEDGEVVVEADLVRRKVAALVGTFAGHIGNMVHGASQDFQADLKIVFSHFPIKTKVEGDRVVIENFLGEKAPRRSKIIPGVKVQVKGSDVEVTGANKEDVGQTAVNIERATAVKGFDLRVFQDGIYIVNKPR